MNPYGQITPWYVQQNQQRAAMAQNNMMNGYNQYAPNWNQPQPNLNQPNRPSMIPGRIIQNPQEITPEEVPMNGTVSLFPANDYSYIVAKQWNQNGLIDTVRFVPEKPVVAESAPSAEPDPFKQEVISRLDKLESLLKPQPQQQPQSQQSTPQQMSTDLVPVQNQPIPMQGGTNNG